VETAVIFNYTIFALIYNVFGKLGDISDKT